MSKFVGERRVYVYAKGFSKRTIYGEKIAASTFLINGHHKNGRTIAFKVVQYTYEDVFEYIKNNIQMIWRRSV